MQQNKKIKGMQVWKHTTVTKYLFP